MGPRTIRSLPATRSPARSAGLAVAGGQAYVAAGGLNVVRVIDLATGARKADWTLPGVADLAVDRQGTLWAVSGKDVVALDRSGRVRGATPPDWRSRSTWQRAAGRLAVVDRTAARLALLDATDGRVLRTLGKPRVAGQWTPVGPETLNDPRGCAFLGDGRLVLTEHARVRILWPETGRISADIVSDFMDQAVVHPTRPEYVYCYMGVFRVDPKTGAWTWLVEAPQGMTAPDRDGKVKVYSYEYPSSSVVLDGRPFIAYATAREQLFMFDVSDPLRPRLALRPSAAQRVLRLAPYSIISCTKGGDILANGDNYGLSFARIPYKGLDSRGDPIYDFEHPVKLGVAKDPSPRGMKCINAPSCDRVTGDIYYLAVTELNKKMVPAWGADGTGVGKSTPEGKPLWFAASSGGNYQSGAVIDDGKTAWYFAGKSFGGQIDLFDADGLRVTTGNWSWPCNYSIGFVDMRYGVQPYVRPDGKVGAYVEDDAVGRFARCRLDGAETVKRTRTDFDWTPTGAAAGGPPDAAPHGRQAIATVLADPQGCAAESRRRLDGLGQGGRRAANRQPAHPRLCRATGRRGCGRRSAPGRPSAPWPTTARTSTPISSWPTTPYISTPSSAGRMWEFDSVELWAEEEQIGLGFVASGKPALFKYRFHNREGKEWSADYALPNDGIWGEKLADLAAHPLGRQLAGFTGVSLAGRTGYALMARIPFEEIKLVGGIAGRKGGEISPLTGSPGEVVRLGVAFGGISAWGREQDFKVNWPSALMYSDPTRSMPFVLGQ